MSIINLPASQDAVEKRLLWAIAGSILVHALLLVASPGRLHYGSGGQNPLVGQAARGQLLVRLTVPPSADSEPIADTLGPVAITVPETDTPDADTTRKEPEAPPLVSRVPDEAAALEVKRGEPVVTASAPVVNDNTRLGLPFVQQQRYYAAKELDVRPQVKIVPVFKYPEAAVANRTIGKVLVDIFINENGQVEDIAVVRAEPAGVFEESVIAGWRTALFTPGIKTSATVKTRLSLEVSFDASQAADAARRLRSQY